MRESGARRAWGGREGKRREEAEAEAERGGSRGVTPSPDPGCAPVRRKIPSRGRPERRLERDVGCPIASTLSTGNATAAPGPCTWSPPCHGSPICSPVYSGSARSCRDSQASTSALVEVPPLVKNVSLSTPSVPGAPKRTSAAHGQ